MSTSPLSPHDVVAAITSGAMDDHLDALVAALNARIKHGRAVRDARALVDLRVGARVRSADNVRPARLAGRTGTVTAMGRTRVHVDLDGVGPCRFTAGSLTVVSEAA